MNKIISACIFLLFVSVFFLVPAEGYAQSANDQIIDSLREELGQKSGIDKVATQLELALKIHAENEREAIEMATSALESAQKTGDRFLEIRAFYVLGRTYFAAGDFGLSETYYNRALSICNETDENWYKGEILFRMGVIDHQKGAILQALDHFNEAIQVCHLSGNYKIAGSSYSMMGTIFRLNGIYDRAIEYTIKSKLNYEKANFSEGDAWAAYLLGRIYMDLRNQDKALEYFEEALGKYQKLAAIDGRKDGVAICYEQIALINLEAGHLEEAKRNVNEVHKIHAESGSKYGLSNAYKIQGRIAYHSGQLAEAEKYMNDALVMKKEVKDLLSLPRIYLYKGLILIKKGEFEEGIANINQGLEISVSNEQRRIQLEIYSKLNDVYLKLNDFEKVIFYQNKQIEIQNEILSGSANIKIEQLQAFYELDQKNSLIEELEKQNEINRLRIKQQKTYQIFIIAGSLFVLLIAVVIVLLYRKIRMKNRELNKINDTKDKLFSIIAHDLKGSIGSSLALSKIVVEESDDKKLINENYAHLIFQSLNNNYNLLSNLLDWARSQFQKMEFNPGHLEFNPVIEDLKNQMSTQIKEKKINLIVETEGAQKIFADEGMLKTILRNLMSNAIKFSSPGGKIDIATYEEQGFTHISVKDYGVGIESEIIPRLFKLDSNASTSGTLGEVGTGLGLILVKDFVEKQGGKIWVESEVGKGSEFIFALPAANS